MALSQRFGHPHSQIPSVLGIPFSYYCSVLGIPRYPPGMPKSLVFWSSPPKNAGFRGKIENVLQMASAKYRNVFQYLKKKAYPEGFTKQDKTTLRKFAKKFEYDSELESLFYVWPRRRMAQRFDDLLSPRKRGSSKSATMLPSAIILLGKSKSGFTGLTTTRTRWKWLVTNFIYLPMHPLDRGF